MNREVLERLEEQLAVLREVAGDYGEMVSLWCVIGQLEARVRWWKSHVCDKDKHNRQA